MERDNEPLSPIELGVASEQTLGAEGRFSDLVGEIPPRQARASSCSEWKETVMERDVEQPEEAIDLGAASEQTLGAEGKVTDLVGMIEHWGIVND